MTDDQVRIVELEKRVEILERAIRQTLGPAIADDISGAGATFGPIVDAPVGTNSAINEIRQQQDQLPKAAADTGCCGEA